MATISVAIGGATRIAGHKQGEHYVVERVVDLASKTFNGGAGASQNDIIEVVSVPDRVFVPAVHVEVLAGEVSATLAAFEVGDGADPNGWHAALDATSAINAFAGVTVGAAVYAAAGGKFYAAADTIDIVITSAGAHVTGIIKVAVAMWPFQRRPVNAV